MVSHKKGNPSESVNLAGDTQRGFGETGKPPVFISRYFIARLRAVINVPQIQKVFTFLVEVLHATKPTGLSRENRHQKCLFLGCL